MEEKEKVVIDFELNYRITCTKEKAHEINALIYDTLKIFCDSLHDIDETSTLRTDAKLH
jgi:hypothetical protein